MSNTPVMPEGLANAILKQSILPSQKEFGLKQIESDSGDGLPGVVVFIINWLRTVLFLLLNRHPENALVHCFCVASILRNLPPSNSVPACDYGKNPRIHTDRRAFQLQQRFLRCLQSHPDFGADA